MEKENKNRSNRIFLIVTIVILLILNSVFLYLFLEKDKQVETTTETLVSTQEAKDELEKLLAETETQLTQYKGKNAELDAFLKEKNDSLQELAERIENIIRQGQVSSSQLKKAKAELESLRYYKKKYLAQIDSLAIANQYLTEENQNLKQTVSTEKRRNEDLTMQNINLGNKVSLGARLKTENIYITGIKTRSNGKERETNKASQLEQLKVSFNLEENLVADKGEKDIYMKVLGPDGATIYVENAGSGSFKFEGEDALYSTKKTISYENKTQTVSIYWSKGSEFVKGDYKVELYADGALIGTGSFKLK